MILCYLFLYTAKTDQNGPQISLYIENLYLIQINHSTYYNIVKTYTGNLPLSTEEKMQNT